MDVATPPVMMWKYVDGKKIGHTLGEDAQELADLLNETFNTKEK
jgi:hypothetical protein